MAKEKYPNLKKYAKEKGIDIKDVGKRTNEIKEKYKDKNKKKKLTIEEKVNYIIEYLGIELEEK